MVMCRTKWGIMLCIIRYQALFSRRGEREQLDSTSHNSTLIRCARQRAKGADSETGAV